MKFLDQCKVYVKSGAGGDGCVSFKRLDRGKMFLTVRIRIVPVLGE